MLVIFALRHTAKLGLVAVEISLLVNSKGKGKGASASKLLFCCWSSWIKIEGIRAQIFPSLSPSSG